MITDQAVEKRIASMEAATGRTRDAWHHQVDRRGLTSHGKIVAWLKQEHGIGHGHANLIALRALEPAGTATDPIERLYGGDKAGLLPIHAALVRAATLLGADVTFAPKKAYISIRRHKQFGLIQPSTRTRIDLGLKLIGSGPTERLEASGSFNAMVSHRIRLEHADAVDRLVVAWLQQAYEQGC